MKTSFEPTKECHPPSDIARMTSPVTVVTTLQCTLKRIQGGEQEWATLCSGEKQQQKKLAEQAFS